MKKFAFIFPGQGAQYVGMGKDLYDTNAAARAVFDQAENVMGAGFQNIIFNGPAEKLTETAYCQPAILTMSVAALKAVEQMPAFQGAQPAFVAGLSLGEYAALTASGALSFPETLRLVKARATYMDEATKARPGKMAAVIGMDKDVLSQICRTTGAEIANYNSLQQTVITGAADKVDLACEQLKSAGAKSVVPLDVAGAFHSSLMQPAADKFIHDLQRMSLQTAGIPLVANVDARPATDPEILRKNLAAQIVSSVRWVDSVGFMASQGVQDFIEIGPGKILKGLLRKTDAALKVYNIEKAEDVPALAQSLTA